MCVRGSVTVVVDDGRQRAEGMLNRPSCGVHVSATIWTTLYRHTPDSAVLTFASQHYQPDDYIRTYDEFLRLAAPSAAS